MLKNALVLLISLAVNLKATASGCDWSESYLEKVTLFEFESSGTLSCERQKVCELTLDNYKDQSVALVLQGQGPALTDSIQKAEFLNARIVKTIEHGSCYNDGVIVSIEVTYDHDVFENYISAKYP